MQLNIINTHFVAVQQSFGIQTGVDLSKVTIITNIYSIKYQKYNNNSRHIAHLGFSSKH